MASSRRGRGHVAQYLYALDRLHEAEDWAMRAARLGGKDDTFTQMISLQFRAKLTARRGDLAQGERLAREAVRVAEGTDAIDMVASAYADLGEVLVLGGRVQDAAETFEQASRRYELKGNLAMTQETRGRIGTLVGSSSPP